jgi:hypothetical protein
VPAQDATPHAGGWWNTNRAAIIEPLKGWLVRHVVWHPTGASKARLFTRPTCSAVRLSARASVVLISVIFRESQVPDYQSDRT